MPLPLIQRGELWLVDLGYLGKVRPVLAVVQAIKFVRRLGSLSPAQMATVETGIAQILGLRLATIH